MRHCRCCPRKSKFSHIQQVPGRSVIRYLRVSQRGSIMAEGITRHKYANVEVTPEQVTPLYDNLLVRRIDDKYDGIVLTSDMTQTKDGTWVKAPDHGPRKGLVVAIGR